MVIIGPVSCSLQVASVCVQVQLRHQWRPAKEHTQPRSCQTSFFANMNAAPQFRSTEESGEKPEFHPRRNGEQSYLREAHLLPETVNPSRWWGLELRRIWSFLFFTVVVALLALGTMGGRATGWCCTRSLGVPRISANPTDAYPHDKQPMAR